MTRHAGSFKTGEQNYAAILTPELVRKLRQLQREGWSYRQQTHGLGMAR